MESETLTYQIFQNTGRDCFMVKDMPDMKYTLKSEVVANYTFVHKFIYSNYLVIIKYFSDKYTPQYIICL